MRQVRIFVGEGEHKTEMGIAYIDPIPDHAEGHSLVKIDITNAKVAMLLRGNQINGVLSGVHSFLSSEEQQDMMERYRDRVVEEILGKEEARRQRPDLFEEENNG